jgi:hypothetical protein
MLLKFVYDLIAAFVIGAGEHFVTMGAVEKQHVTQSPFSSFSSSRANLQISIKRFSGRGYRQTCGASSSIRSSISSQP